MKNSSVIPIKLSNAGGCINGNIAINEILVRKACFQRKPILPFQLEYNCVVGQRRNTKVQSHYRALGLSPRAG